MRDMQDAINALLIKCDALERGFIYGEYLDSIAKDMARATPSTREFKWACA
jgi:hypothetical protein